MYWSGVKRQFLDLRVHTDPVPGPQKPLILRHALIRRRRVALSGGVHWQYVRVVAVLGHADSKAIRETLSGSVEVAEHCVAPPPPDEPDCVRVNVCHEERHCPPPAWIERALTSCGMKPMVRTVTRTTIQMAAGILVILLVTHVSLCCTSARGVVPMAP